MPRMSRQSPRTIAARQRVRNEAARVNLSFDRLVTDFENEMRNLRTAVCPHCRKRTKPSDISDQKCSACRRSGTSLFTAANGMDIGDIPRELSELTMIEQILIARVHPIVSVFKIRGQQRAYSGHVMNFVQHVDQIATILPHHPRTLTNVVLLNRSTPDGVIHFRVRSGVVRRALYWLKHHNQYYSDIQVDEDVLSNLPVDGDVINSLPTLEVETDSLDNYRDEDLDNNIDRSCYPSMPAINAASVIAQNLERASSIISQPSTQVGEWPDLNSQPANEFRTEGLICKAFPVLFPYGRGDLHAPRLHKITHHKYFKYLMQFDDGRFANDIRFPYYAYNSVARWDALNCGNVYVQHHNLERLSAEQWLQVVNDPNHDLAARIMYYGANLRGTRAYWKQRCTELTQMVRQLGSPAIFFTLSAADYHWPDLYRIIAPDADINTLDARQRSTLMHENPATVAWFFDQRCDIFMKKFMIKFFSVKDYWFRYEWQHRGSPHIHGLLWFDDSPDCKDIDSLDDNSREAIIEYFDQLVSARIGDRRRIACQTHPCQQRYTDLTDDEKLQDLDRLLTCVQRHYRCGRHCQRRKTNSRLMECRFGFPIQLEERSCLRLESGSWRFIPERNDTLMQRYNKFVTRVWRGNTDFSAITSMDSVLKYISKYASKCEHASEAYSEILARVIRRNPDDAPAATLIRQLIVTSVAERNFSAQEVMHLLMGWPLWHSSRTVVVLSIRDDWQPLRGESNRIMTRYSTREPELSSLCLFEYTKWYRHQSGSSVKRAKEVIVRVVPFLKLSDDLTSNEDYYKLQCKLYIPWCRDFEQLLPRGATWQDFFLTNRSNRESTDPFDNILPQMPDEVQYEENRRDAANIIRDAAMAASRLEPVQRRVDPLGQRPIDEAHVWHNFSSINITQDEILEFLRSYKSGPQINPTNESLIPFELMSVEQQTVLTICRRQISDPCYNIKRVLVQGKAGTGKSALIKAICHLLDQSRLTDRPNYQVVAPTGAAAINVDGKTIHSFFCIPVSGDLDDLNGDRLRNFQLRLRDIRFIIIDEYSMIGMNLLQKIHKRLCEARGSTNHPFGGYFLYLFGDIRQLPPVQDTAIYMIPPTYNNFSRMALRLVASMQKRIILSVCHRQNEEQHRFKQVLDDIASGAATREGWDLLMTRRISLHHSNISSFRNAIHLFPTNAQVDAHNQLVISWNQRPVALIQSDNNNTHAIQGSDANAQGLAYTLYLSIGCRIMLRRNICVEVGLVNGSLGTVTDIIYSEGQSPPSLPFALLIEFDRYTGPPFLGRERTFPLLPVQTSWRSGIHACTRKQFPIHLAYALTIHKAQGLTLDKLFVDVGEKENSPGLTYVALSRVRKLEDLILTQFDFSRLAAIGRMKHVLEREKWLNEMF